MALVLIHVQFQQQTTLPRPYIEVIFVYHWEKKEYHPAQIDRQKHVAFDESLMQGSAGS